MSVTFAFDIYGTLIDTQGVVAGLKRLVGERAAAFAETWRSKQLEYAFRKGLMQRFEDFSVCTSQALDYACAYYKAELSEAQKSQLLATYRVLPAFSDVDAGLSRLQADGHRLFAFSNGSTEAVEALLRKAGIRHFFEGVISVADLSTFKPNPAVYRYFLDRARVAPQQACLVSSNPFDVIGAISADMKAAWLKRSSNAIFDPWDIEPDLTVGNLKALAEAMSSG